MKAFHGAARFLRARLRFFPTVCVFCGLVLEVTTARAQSIIALDHLLSNGAILNIPNATSLTFTRGGTGTLTNDGTVSLNSGGNLTDLILSGGTITFAGSGTVTMSNNGNNRIYGAATTDALINASTHTIQGAGQIGRGVTGLTNQGFIIANQAAGLTVQPNSSGMTNTGTLRASNGATLTLQGGTFASTGGTIEAQDTSRVDVNGATISGGTLATGGTGTIRAINQSTFSGVTIASGGVVELPNAHRLDLTGTINNAGTLKLLSGGNLTDLVITSDGTTLDGGGAISASSDGNNRIYGSTATTTLVNKNNTISGAGQIGANQLQLDNRSTIDANTNGSTLTVDLSGTGGTNTGTIQATNGGILRVQGTTLNNANGNLVARSGSKLQVAASSTVSNGTIAVQGGGTLELESSTVSGGTLSNAATGIIKTTGGTNTLGSALTNSAGAEVQVANNTTLQLLAAGTFNNDGTVSLNSGGNLTNLIVSGGNVTLGGTGNVALSNNGNNRIYGADGATDRLINGAGHTIQGSGQLGVGLMGFTNQGTVVANQSTALTLDPSALGATNTGTFRATNNAILEVTNGTYTNHNGTMEALAGSTVRFENANVTGGTLSSTGTGHLLHASASTFTDVAIASGTVFDFNNATSATFGGGVTNHGNLKLNSGGNLTDLVAASGGLSLSGGGTITFSDNPNNRIYGATSTTTLVNMDNTIRGSGQVGANQLQFDNRGTVEANLSGKTLTIDPSGTGVTNTGTLQAVNGGILELQGGTFNNAGGVVRAQTGSTVRLESATVSNGTFDVGPGGSLTLSSSTIDGGTISGSSTGSISTVGGANTLGGTVTINSGTQLNIANNTNLKLLATGSYTHNGTLSLLSGGNLTDLIINGGDVVLDGTGTIALGDNGNNRIYGSATTDRLVLKSGLTLKGGGQVGVGLMGLSSAGTVEANQPNTPLVLNPNASGVTNTGILRATSGATLRLTSGSYANAGGSIEAQDGSRVNFESATVSGGLLLSSGSGRLVNAVSSTYSGVTLTGSSVFDVNNNTSATLAGTFVNQGNVNLKSGGNFTDLVVSSGGLTLGGGGVIALGDNFNNRIYGSTASGTPTLVNQNNTIRGAGQIGVNLLAIENRGTIEANLPNSTLEIDTAGSGLTNLGTLRAVNGGILKIESSSINNTSGTILADAGSKVDLSTATITGGTLRTGSGGVIRTVAGASTLGGNLALDSGAQVNVNNNTSLTLLAAGLYTNSGVISLLSGGNFTDLRVSGGDVTVSGGGSITLGNNGNNRILGSGGTDRLVNSSGHLIQGSGQIGVGLMGLLNQGTVIANQPTSLTIDPSAAGVTNTGRLRADTGSTLRLQNGVFTNTNGTIEAVGAGAVVEFSNATITNGTLTSGTGAALRHLGGSTFNDVTLSAGSSFDVLNNTLAHFGGTFLNNAVLSLNSGGNFTDFIVDGDVALDGSGTIVMGNNANNRIYASLSTSKLINKNNTIVGSGQIGVGLMGLVNQATIRANQSTPLVIDPSSAGVTNTGLLRADSGATLQLQNGAFANNGGTIEAFGAGSVVHFSSATINNGTLRSSDGGLLKNIASSTFNDVALSAGSKLQIPNNTAATFTGTLTNGGVVELASGGNFTDFLVGTGGVTLVGGAIELGNNGNNRIYSPSGSTTLTNQSSAIRGAGQLGVGLTKIDNRGTIDANLSGATLTVDPNSNGVVNTGMMMANNGGILRLKGGTYTNTGGFITAGSGSRVELDNATISGGTIGGSTIRNIAGSTLSALSIGGGATVEIPNNTALTFTGAIGNSGLVQLQSGGNLTDLIIGTGGVTLNGHGVIELGNNGNNRIYGTTGATSLNNVDNVIRGSGQLGVNQLTLTNSGTIEANQSTPLTVNLANATPFTNQGTLRATNGANLIFTDNLVNAFIVNVQAGSTFTGQGTYTQSGGGTILTGGTLTAASHAFQSGGVLQGTGTVNGPVTNGGVITPGASATGNGIGQLTFNHALTLTSTSLLHMEIGGRNDYDKIQAPSAALNGSLLVTLTNGFQSTIQSSDTFTLLSTTSTSGLTGTFAGFAGGSRIFTADGFGSFQVNYLANGFQLSQFAATIPEPSTYVLLSLGAVVLLGLRLRRR